MKILALGIFLLLLGCTSSPANESVPVEDQSLDGNYVYLEMKDIGTSLTHYEYDYQGKTIKYFAVLDSSGDVKVAFDACEVCYNSHKGYSQQGDAVVCNNCGLKFRIDDLGERNKNVGCWPSHLPHVIDGSYVKISKADIESGARLF